MACQSTISLLLHALLEGGLKTKQAQLIKLRLF